jgi:hypothetical protein
MPIASLSCIVFLMFHRFEFEAEFYPTLARIPFHVRMKLDRAGVKLSLNTWHAFSLEERRVLCHLPDESEEERSVFTAYLTWLSRTRASAETERVPVLRSSMWKGEEVPEAVKRRSDANGSPMAPKEWRRLAEHERYALYKTAVSKDPNLFNEALEEMRGKVRSERIP